MGTKFYLEGGAGNLPADISLPGETDCELKIDTQAVLATGSNHMPTVDGPSSGIEISDVASYLPERAAA